MIAKIDSIGRHCPHRVPDPTPREIRLRCQAIQKEWSPGERFRRSSCMDYVGNQQLLNVATVSIVPTTEAMRSCADEDDLDMYGCTRLD